MRPARIALDWHGPKERPAMTKQSMQWTVDLRPGPPPIAPA